MKKSEKSLNGLIDQKQDIDKIKGGQQLRTHDIKQVEFKKDGEGVSGNVGNKLFVEQGKTVDKPIQ